MPSIIFRTLFALAVLLGVSGSASAQGTLVGRVVDEAGAPVPGVEVRVGGVSGTTSTDQSGWFRVPGVRVGLFYFGVRRVGYRPASDMLRFTGTDTVDVMIERISPELDTVKVQARADAQWERDMRRYEFAIDASRFGTVITDEDIQRRSPIWTSDMLQNQAGFRVIGTGSRARLIGSRESCAPVVFLDGMPVPGFNINDISPQFIKLIVAYRSASSVPAQLQTARGNPNCGTVAIFTM